MTPRSSSSSTRTHRHPGRLPYLLLLPAFVLELLVHVVPLVLGVWISLLRLTPRELRDWTSAPFVGAANFRAWLDPGGPIGAELLASTGRTVLYTALVVGASWALGMLAALLLATPFRGRAFWQAFFLVPFALPAFVTVLAWRFMLDRDAGMLNHLLVDDLGVVDSRPFWLIGDNAFWATVVVSVWRLWPLAYLVLAAALRTVPADLYAAARVDGATAWQRFRYITLPMTRRPSTMVLLVMGLWSFTDFSTPYLLFDAQPPPAATLLGSLVYRHAFVDFDFGLAAALNALVAIVLIVVGGLCAWRLLLRRAADG
ncbi:carbohydrate ABC transporter permease [Nocardioides sp. LHG3406-4]|uniref:carbohydrate ABC transporter permease n=1 Tax=Nocardioides sp. LHG3406-4 TaxID=2804575 RepID=UPI003CE7AE4C